MEEKLITRRGFISAAAATAALLGLTGCASNAPSVKSDTSSASGMPEKWDYESDVVVVGGGGAGLMAAAAAQEQGATVTIVEKADMVGGDTGICACLMCGNWPDYVKDSFGLEDSAEKYIDDWKNSHQFSAKGRAGEAEVGDLSYVERMQQLMPEVYDWLQDAGVEWQPFPSGAWYPLPNWETVPRQWIASNGIIPPLSQYISKLDGVKTITGQRATELIKDADGRVVGVRAIDSSGKFTVFKGEKGVILATGSFNGDRSMVNEYLGSSVANLIAGGVPSNTGDGHRMAQMAGASLKEMGLGVHYFGKGLGNFGSAMIGSWTFCGDQFGEFAGGTPGVLINFDGKRFVSETLGYNITATVLAEQRNQIGFYVFDSQSAPIIMENEVSNTDGDIMFEADTLEELANQIRVDPATFVAEIERYNGFVDAGRDDDFQKIVTGCSRIEEGPFYALEIIPMPYTTYGGIDVDVDGHVLDSSGSAIGGLYAAGICTGSFSAQAGLFYTGGVCQAMSFGRQSGKNAATGA